MDVANEILDAIEIIVDKKIRENTAQIYFGICKGVSGDSCVMSINGKNNTIHFYGSAPIVGLTYRVFVPNGNMSMAFAITGNDDRKGLYYSNPNLLDNWYFGNPVNQRGVYVVPPNTQIYADEQLTNTSPGVTSDYRKVEYVNSTYCIYRGEAGTSLYFVKSSDAVCNYTVAGYTIDRWAVWPGITVTLNSDGTITLTNTGSEESRFYQTVEGVATVAHTLSILVKSISGTAKLYFQQAGSPYQTPIATDISTGLTCSTGVPDVNERYSVIITLSAGATVQLIAAKLELGSQQTLAHQDANGNWVLNEIPDYGEQLRRCQRYFQALNSAGPYFIFGSGLVAKTNNVVITFRLPVTMRTLPAVTFSGSFASNSTSFEGISSIVVSERSTSIVTLTATIPDVFTVGNCATLQDSGDNTACISFSADL